MGVALLAAAGLTAGYVVAAVVLGRVGLAQLRAAGGPARGRHDHRRPSCFTRRSAILPATACTISKGPRVDDSRPRRFPPDADAQRFPQYADSRRCADVDFIVGVARWFTARAVTGAPGDTATILG
ncbi:hypothetical protein [Micromonospora aurantiaca]|uniref:hypothetical protein n=1 Tax=Micromonospora aurantiaca (nom. illeg.) TaxID=47850 RepID=UPI001E4B5AD1|nr:hypothetical protein [Micromonospora aurantiaca]UFN96854.1 hypothetical protein LF814_12315 [Micromonospora aurantiaca]